MKVPKIFIQWVAPFALITLFVVPALAQRGKWWNDEDFQRELGLTAEQSARLEEIFQRNQPVLRERMHALNQAERKFDELVEKGDDASVLAYVGTLEETRGELSKARTIMLLRMRRSLTADQWAKFRALADRRGRERSSDHRRR